LDFGGILAIAQRTADAICIVGFVGQNDRIPVDVVEQCVGNLSVLRLTRCQTEPDRESLRIDDRMDFGGEAALGATETMI